MNTEEIRSVGIDIGTTTTSMVLSLLRIENVAKGFGVPSVRIVDKRILFRSDVMFTPFSTDGAIDGERIEAFLSRQFGLCSVRPADIRTGAVIVTGQAAHAANARAIAQAVSRFSGSFVVATAGAHLEAYISGLGAGAATLSKKRNLRLMNLDIGGGTTNISVFDRGVFAGTLCFDIGGRLVRFVAGTSVVEHVTDPGRIVASCLGLPVAVGKTLDERGVFAFAGAMAGSLLSVIEGSPDAPARRLAIDNREGFAPRCDCVSFSGGVGRLLYLDEGERVPGYDDMGAALARELRRRTAERGVTVIAPEETIYATVIGAGVHTVDISGSTIFLSDASVLPLRDIPVVSIGNAGNGEDLSAKIRLFGADRGRMPAIAAPAMRSKSFADVSGLASAVAAAADSCGLDGPLVILCADDIGKIVGGLVKNRLRRARAIVSIDQVSARELDYIDIGEPLHGGTVVPVAVKTLVFPDEGTGESRGGIS